MMRFPPFTQDLYKCDVIDLRSQPTILGKVNATAGTPSRNQRFHVCTTQFLWTPFLFSFKIISCVLPMRIKFAHSLRGGVRGVRGKPGVRFKCFPMEISPHPYRRYDGKTQLRM